MERLDDVVTRAPGQSLLLILQGILGADDHHGNVAGEAMLLDGTQHRLATGPLEHHIQQDQIRLTVDRHDQGPVTIIDFHHIKFIAEQGRKDLAMNGTIIDYHHTGLGLLLATLTHQLLALAGHGHILEAREHLPQRLTDPPLSR